MPKTGGKMIIQFNTGKTDIVLVKVPEGYEDYKINITEELEIQLIHKMGDVQSLCACPEGNWQIVGNPFELSEERWKSILYSFGGRMFDKDPKDYASYQDYAFIDHPFDTLFFETAKESSITLLNHLRVYQVNPLGKDLCEHNSQCYTGCQGSCWTRSNVDYDEWEEAEERTGKWVLLTAVKA